jgi:hypothetical protein
MDWTEEARKELVERWMAGESATYIAKILGTTRGAVMGKLHRLGVLRQRDKALGGPRPISLPRIGDE